MKYWTITLGLIAVLSGCSPQQSSTVDESLLGEPTGSSQGKPVPPGDLPYFDWDLLDGIIAVQSNTVRVSAGTKQYSDANLLVTLRGQAYSSADTIAQVRWWQVSGPASVIANPNQLHTQVVLPEVSEPATAIFRLAAITRSGEVNSAQVAVMILPVSAPVTLASVAVQEGESELNFVVRLAEPAREPILFTYATEDGSALADKDYLPTRGVLTFQPGQTHQTLSVPLVSSSISTVGNKLLFMQLQAELADQPVILRAVGFIVGRESRRNNLSSAPVAAPLDPASAADQPGQAGSPRLVLRWEEGAMVRVVVQDPCGNVTVGGQPPSSCQGYAPVVQTGTLSGDFFSFFENMAWTAGAAGGYYQVYLEHVAGRAVDYSLNVYNMGVAERFTGLIANGERVEITSLLVDGSANPGGRRVTGNILDATNTAPMTGARVRLYAAETLVVDEVVSDSFDVPVEFGTYRMVVTAEGYQEWVRDVSVTIDEPVVAVRVALSPVFGESDMARMVLSWGREPFDLDSHLLGPGFHLYFSQKAVGGATLDVDDVDSFGPETVTIQRWQSGLYRYYIQDFSAGANLQSTTLANSGAVVELYLDGADVQVFRVPEGVGIFWHVFDYDSTTGELIPVNVIRSDEGTLQTL